MTMDTRTRWLALIVLCLGTLMIVLDSTIVNVALPSIRTDLHFSQTSLAWVVNAHAHVRRIPPPGRTAG
jgi:MFS family permease